MSNMRARNLVASIFLLILSGGYAYLTAHLPTRAIENTTQPSFFPWIDVVILIGLSVILLVQASVSKINPDIQSKNTIAVRPIVLGLLLALAYMFTLPTLGFVLANIPLFGGLMYLYGETRPVWIVLGSSIISVVTFLIFRNIFQIGLPIGLLGEFI